MDVRRSLIDRITAQFTRIRLEVAARNSLHLNDLNIHAEEFFKTLLNKVYNYNLINLNLDSIVAKAIDLGDYDARVAIQVTSDNSKRKINETFKKFCEDAFHHKFNNLKILVIGNRTARVGTIKHEDFVFDYKSDVIDLNAILKAIQGLDTVKLTEISDWLTFELELKPKYTVSTPDQQDFDRYFAKFLNPELDPRLLLLQAQPTLADCREVFSDEYYKNVHSLYSIFYYSILNEEKSLGDNLRDKDVYKQHSSSFSEVKDGKHNLPGGMSTIYNIGALRPGKLRYYDISFQAKNSEHGISFKIWVYLNGRWVFFPKPWHIVPIIHSLKTERRFKFLLKILKWIGFKGVISKDQAYGVFITTFLLGELTQEK